MNSVSTSGEVEPLARIYTLIVCKSVSHLSFVLTDTITIGITVATSTKNSLIHQLASGRASDFCYVDGIGKDINRKCMYVCILNSQFTANQTNMACTGYEMNEVLY